jgi:hypothetical protein
MVTLLHSLLILIGTLQYGYPSAFSSQIDWHFRKWLPYYTPKLIGALKYGYTNAFSSPIDWYMTVWLPYCTLLSTCTLIMVTLLHSLFKLIGTVEYGYPTALSNRLAHYNMVTLLHWLPYCTLFSVVCLFIKTSFIQEYRVLSSVK